MRGYVGGVGLACPLGLSWPAACAALRAELSRHRLSSYRDDDGREIVASWLPEDILPERPRRERWLALLALSLQDLASRVGAQVLEELPLLVAVPETTPAWHFPVSVQQGPATFRGAGDGAEQGRETVARNRELPSPEVAMLTSALSRRLGGLQLRVRVVAGSGGFAGLSLLGTGVSSATRGGACVVAAADSLVAPSALSSLSSARRLLVEGTPDGVVPGEAAVAVLLGPESRGALGEVIGFGSAEEISRLDNDEPMRAQGLSEAAKAALDQARLGLHEIDFRVSDAAGESFFFKEQALMLARVMRQRRERQPLWLPAEGLGDTGVAASLCGLAWALAAWARGYAPGGRAMVFGGGDVSKRAALVVQR